MKIIAYPVSQPPCIIRPATPKRDWMDDTPGKYSYRCLPLNIANSWGWEVISDSNFIAEWNGGPNATDIKINKLSGQNAPASHFGNGVLTWYTGYIFKTEYPIGLYVTGAPNYPKPNVTPLSGIVETHWLTFSFTMNWKFTQPGEFRMEAGEPFCQIFPIDLSIFDKVIPTIETLHVEENKELHDSYWEWNISRHKFSRNKTIGKETESWQKNYMRGTYPPDGVRKCPVHHNPDGTLESTHRTKSNVPEFVDRQTEPFKTPQSHLDALAQQKIDESEFLNKKLIEQNKPTIIETDNLCILKYKE